MPFGAHTQRCACLSPSTPNITAFGLSGRGEFVQCVSNHRPTTWWEFYFVPAYRAQLSFIPATRLNTGFPSA